MTEGDHDQGGPGLDLQQAAGDDKRTAASYQHTVLAQTSLPYRDPGAGVRSWERVNGLVRLRVEAGMALHPDGSGWVELGLPFGPKPRLILALLNAEALRTRNPEIEVEASLTAFARGLLGHEPNGREIRLLKGQLARLSAASIRLGLAFEGHALTVNTQIVGAFDLWFPKDARQRVLWPASVRLSLDYFESLQRHAVPLDNRALAALSRNAMALDIYAWLAQRLHRAALEGPTLVPWMALKAHFGPDYDHMFKFRQVFRRTLALVHAQYPAARFELTGRGMMLYRSPPPILWRKSLAITGSKPTR